MSAPIVFVPIDADARGFAQSEHGGLAPERLKAILASRLYDARALARTSWDCAALQQWLGLHDSDRRTGLCRRGDFAATRTLSSALYDMAKRRLLLSPTLAVPRPMANSAFDNY